MSTGEDYFKQFGRRKARKLKKVVANYLEKLPKMNNIIPELNKDGMKILKIEIEFPTRVDIHREIQRRLHELMQQVCKDNCPDGQVLWMSTSGFKMIHMPVTQEEERHRGMEFDEDIYYLGASIREKHKGE